MSDEFNHHLLRMIVARICQPLGVHGMHMSVCDALADVLKNYLLTLGKTTAAYSWHANRTDPTLGDLQQAFQDLDISLSDLSEFTREVNSLPLVHHVPKYPLPRSSSHVHYHGDSEGAGLTRQSRRGSLSSEDENERDHIPSYLPPLPSTKEEKDEAAQEDAAATPSSNVDMTDATPGVQPTTLDPLKGLPQLSRARGFSSDFSEDGEGGSRRNSISEWASIGVASTPSDNVPLKQPEANVKGDSALAGKSTSSAPPVRKQSTSEDVFVTPSTSTALSRQRGSLFESALSKKTSEPQTTDSNTQKPLSDTPASSQLSKTSPLIDAKPPPLRLMSPSTAEPLHPVIPAQQPPLSPLSRSPLSQLTGRPTMPRLSPLRPPLRPHPSVWRDVPPLRSPTELVQPVIPIGAHPSPTSVSAATTPSGSTAFPIGAHPGVASSQQMGSQPQVPVSMETKQGPHPPPALSKDGEVQKPQSLELIPPTSSAETATATQYKVPHSPEKVALKEFQLVTEKLPLKRKRLSKSSSKSRSPTPLTSPPSQPAEREGVAEALETKKEIEQSEENSLRLSLSPSDNASGTSEPQSQPGSVPPQEVKPEVPPLTHKDDIEERVDDKAPSPAAEPEQKVSQLSDISSDELEDEEEEIESHTCTLQKEEEETKDSDVPPLIYHGESREEESIDDKDVTQPEEEEEEEEEEEDRGMREGSPVSSPFQEQDTFSSPIPAPTSPVPEHEDQIPKPESPASPETETETSFQTVKELSPVVSKEDDRLFDTQLKTEREEQSRSRSSSLSLESENEDDKEEEEEEVEDDQPQLVFDEHSNLETPFGKSGDQVMNIDEVVETIVEKDSVQLTGEEESREGHVTGASDELLEILGQTVSSDDSEDSGEESGEGVRGEGVRAAEEDDDDMIETVSALPEPEIQAEPEPEPKPLPPEPEPQVIVTSQQVKGRSRKVSRDELFGLKKEKPPSKRSKKKQPPPPQPPPPPVTQQQPSSSPSSLPCPPLSLLVSISRRLLPSTKKETIEFPLKKKATLLLTKAEMKAEPMSRTSSGGSVLKVTSTPPQPVDLSPPHTPSASPTPPPPLEARVSEGETTRLEENEPLLVSFKRRLLQETSFFVPTPLEERPKLHPQSTTAERVKMRLARFSASLTTPPGGNVGGALSVATPTLNPRKRELDMTDVGVGQSGEMVGGAVAKRQRLDVNQVYGDSPPHQLSSSSSSSSSDDEDSGSDSLSCTPSPLPQPSPIITHPSHPLPSHPHPPHPHSSSSEDDEPSTPASSASSTLSGKGLKLTISKALLQQAQKPLHVSIGGGRGRTSGKERGGKQAKPEKSRKKPGPKKSTAAVAPPALSETKKGRRKLQPAKGTSKGDTITTSKKSASGGAGLVIRSSQPIVLPATAKSRRVPPISVPIPTPTAPPQPHAGSEYHCPECGLRDDGSPMIGCDGCDSWVHWTCAGVTREPPADEKWYCSSCEATKRGGAKGGKKGRKKKRIT